MDTSDARRREGEGDGVTLGRVQVWVEPRVDPSNFHSFVVAFSEHEVHEAFSVPGDVLCERAQRVVEAPVGDVGRHPVEAQDRWQVVVSIQGNDNVGAARAHHDGARRSFGVVAAAAQRDEVARSEPMLWEVAAAGPAQRGVQASTKAGR